MNEIVLALKGVDKFLYVSCLQGIQGVHFVGGEVVDLPDLEVKLADLLEVFLEFRDVEGLYLFEVLADQRHLHQFLVDLALFLVLQQLQGVDEVRHVKVLHSWRVYVQGKVQRELICKLYYLAEVILFHILTKVLVLHQLHGDVWVLDLVTVEFDL